MHTTLLWVLAESVNWPDFPGNILNSRPPVNALLKIVEWLLKLHVFYKLPIIDSQS